MFSTLATIVLVVSLVLGGGGVTVAAAQNSQPDQPLYGVKVLSEDVRLGLSADPQSEYQLALEFANRRAEEIRAMLQAGSIPPEAVQTRYQNQVEQAIQFALNLPNDQAVQALEQIRTRLQTQQQAFLQVQTNGSPKAEAVLVQCQQMLQERLQWVEQGLTDPAKLRDQLRLRDQQRKQDRQNSATPAVRPPRYRREQAVAIHGPPAPRPLAVDTVPATELETARTALLLAVDRVEIPGPLEPRHLAAATGPATEPAIARTAPLLAVGRVEVPGRPAHQHPAADMALVPVPSPPVPARPDPVMVLALNPPSRKTTNRLRQDLNQRNRTFSRRKLAPSPHNRTINQPKLAQANSPPPLQGGRAAGPNLIR